MEFKIIFNRRLGFRICSDTSVRRHMVAAFEHTIESAIRGYHVYKDATRRQNELLRDELKLGELTVIATYP